MLLTDIINWFKCIFFDLNGVFIGFECGFNVMFN